MAPEDTSHSANPWEFTAALDLLAAWKPRTPSPPRLSRRPKTPPPPSSLNLAHLYDPKASKPSSLGDLDRLFDFLGLPQASSPCSTQELTESTSSSASDKSTPPSSLPDEPGLEDFIRKGKEVRWTDEVPGSDIAGYERRSTRSSSFGLRILPRSLENSDAEDSTPSRNARSRRRSRARSVAAADTSEFESEPELLTYRIRDRNEENEEDTSLLINTTLIPSFVTPIQRPKAPQALWGPPPITNTPFSPHEIRPIDILTREQKCAKLVKKLQRRFSTDSTALIRMTQDHASKHYDGNLSPDGIHVFVDCSNIVIGFINQLKMARGMNVRSPAKGGKISWPALAMILERGRPVARRILVGSHGSPLDSRQPKRPEYMTEAEICGYELNILDRVIKNKDVTPYKKNRGNGNGYATTSGYSSGSDGTYMTRKAVTEQGVDEILHMKLLESLIDTASPATIVLASGDAAEAEYSGGFMKNVERALRNGWRVELVAWSAGLSRDYQSPAFLKRWEGQFFIILLDDFSEEMFASYANK
ncbi:hypothetical protein D0Z07_9374 [Hyphodiscus hymeniophilus]|uniref:NYN domain-containing protein n=1 Tax=Hyphodiscus hymeniophilus TaxID=353542 RepID=A0A9P6VC43_9HELO|nr:hypothetical protein D0Z07_9374 [Hyphodiscus hymeniophilus]